MNDDLIVLGVFACFLIVGIPIAGICCFISKIKEGIRNKKLTKQLIERYNKWLDNLKSHDGNISGYDVQGLVLDNDEQCFYNISGVDLYSLKAHRVGGYNGVSIPVYNGIRINTGGYSGTSVQEFAYADTGNFYLTNKRLIFIGCKHTSTMRLNKILAIDASLNAVQVKPESSGVGKTQHFANLDGLIVNDLFNSFRKAS